MSVSGYDNSSGKIQYCGYLSKRVDVSLPLQECYWFFRRKIDSKTYFLIQLFINEQISQGLTKKREKNSENWSQRPWNKRSIRHSEVKKKWADQETWPAFEGKQG